MQALAIDAGEGKRDVVHVPRWLLMLLLLTLVVALAALGISLWTLTHPASFADAQTQLANRIDALKATTNASQGNLATALFASLNRAAAQQNDTNARLDATISSVRDSVPRVGTGVLFASIPVDLRLQGTTNYSGPFLGGAGLAGTWTRIDAQLTIYLEPFTATGALFAYSFAIDLRWFRRVDGQVLFLDAPSTASFSACNTTHLLDSAPDPGGETFASVKAFYSPASFSTLYVHVRFASRLPANTTIRPTLSCSFVRECPDLNLVDTAACCSQGQTCDMPVF